MRTNIKATGISLTPEIREYIEKRLLTFDKFIPTEDDAVICQVEVGKTTQHHKNGEIFRAEITMHMKHGTIRAEAEAVDLYTAIDMVKDELNRELTSRKDKKITLVRRGAHRVKGIIKGVYDWGGKWGKKGWRKIRRQPEMIDGNEEL